MERNGPYDKTGRAPVDDSGFMLLEVMASVLILGLAVVAVIQLFAGSLRLARMSDDYTEMVLLARDRMSETLLNDPLTEGSASGTTADGTRWSVEVSGYEGHGVEFANSEAYRIYSVAVRVSGEEKKGREYTLTTLKTVLQ